VTTAEDKKGVDRSQYFVCAVLVIVGAFLTSTRCA
jgi:hypothetical protein